MYRQLKLVEISLEKTCVIPSLATLSRSLLDIESGWIKKSALELELVAVNLAWVATG